MTHQLSLAGEFQQPERETAYRQDRLPEWRRHACLVCLCAAAINLLFYLSDWRFHGQPHFVTAITARTVIVVVSLACARLLRQARSLASLHARCLLWNALVIPAGAALLTPHTDTALFVSLLLPGIIYLAMPLPFAWTVASGTLCSVATLGAYLSGGPTPTLTGLILGMLTLNTALVLVIVRANRLQRQEWSATNEARRANEDLLRQRMTLRTFLTAVPVPLVILDTATRTLLDVNAAARDFFGQPALDDAAAFRQRFTPPLPDAAAAPGEPLAFEARVEAADTSTRDVLVTITKVAANAGSILLAAVVDITRRKQKERTLEQLAHTDPLTGLVNRCHFETLAAMIIRQCHGQGDPLTLVMLDIDHFKNINDTYGHQTGDAALRAFARLCRSMIRDRDVAGRYGGEEFVLLLPATDAAGALALTERLRQATQSLPLGTPGAAITISAGISSILAGENDLHAALGRADAALYQAKNSGRNKAVLHPTVPSLS